MDTRQSIEAAVLEAMREQGVSRVALAEGADIPMGTLRRRLRGESAFKVPELVRVARFLDRDVAYFTDAAA